MTASRKTPTQSNGGSDNGVTYTDAVDSEVEALWRYLAEPLTSIGGTGDAITANSFSAIVSAVLSIDEGKKVYLTAAADNTGGDATLTVDGLTKHIRDQDGALLQQGAIKNGRRHFFEFDGANLRLLNAASNISSTLEYGTNGGRLSLTTLTPVLTAAVTAATLLYWTPDFHNRIALYDGAAWSVLQSAEKSIKATHTQTGTTHNGTKIIDGLTDTSQLVVGMKISGTNVGAAATIQSVDSATQVTATVNSTGSATNSITFKLPANTGYDVYGKVVSSALKLFFVARAALFTVTSNTTQDGVVVKSGDTTLRHLGAFRTSNTDGQIDYTFLGQYRFSIWNRYNHVYRMHDEPFGSGGGTWFKSMCTTRVTMRVLGAGGGGSTSGVAATAGGSSAFGAHASANGGGATGADGTASSGDVNSTGLGAPGGGGDISGGGWQGGNGGLSIRSRMAVDLGTTETVTVGAGGAASGSGSAGRVGTVEAFEILEI